MSRCFKIKSPHKMKKKKYTSMVASPTQFRRPLLSPTRVSQTGGEEFAPETSRQAINHKTGVMSPKMKSQLVLAQNSSSGTAVYSGGGPQEGEYPHRGANYPLRGNKAPSAMNEQAYEITQ
jgi:hypothetical protein